MTTRRRFLPAAIGLTGAATVAIASAAVAPIHPRCPLRILDWRRLDKDGLVLYAFGGGRRGSKSKVLVNGKYPDRIFYVDLDNGLVGSYAEDHRTYEWHRGKVELFDNDGTRWV